MLKTLVLAGLLVFGGAQVAWADETASDLPLCPSWSVNVETDLVLWQAIDTAYPSAEVGYVEEEPGKLQCLFPHALLRYDRFMVLIALTGEPGEACHGCPARVSAVFLERDRNALRVIARQDGFTEAGTFGSLMAVSPIRLGAEEGLIVEGGGTFQGYSSSALSPFLIRNWRLEPVGPENGISSGDSNCGVRDGPCRDVSGSWHAQDKRLVVRYVGRRQNRTAINGSVVYELRKGSLIRISGHRLAREMEESRP